MTILCTFPGRHGDLLWALPTVRAVSQHFNQPVDLKIAGEFKGLKYLLSQQPYIRQVHVAETWGLTPDQRIPPLALSDESLYERVYHLAYRGWPQTTLPHETESCLWAQWHATDGLPPSISLEPWITPPPAQISDAYAVMGWTETWFELKVGIEGILRRREYMTVAAGHVRPRHLNISNSGRWMTEDYGFDLSWESAASLIKAAPVFVGDCSALHVLAVAMGVPVIVVEPMEARHNAIFYPLGKDGPRVTLLKGGDGQPTFDARHLWDALQPYVQQTQAGRA